MFELPDRFSGNSVSWDLESVVRFMGGVKGFIGYCVSSVLGSGDVFFLEVKESLVDGDGFGVYVN